MKKMAVFISIVACVFFLFTGCVSGGNSTSSLDPDKAVYSLASVAKTATGADEGVYYCIFVRSFSDSDGDGIGDFRGITEKLDYLNDGNDLTTSDLGVTGLWLMPIYPSQTYHGYDVDDYYNVNSAYGTMEDFENLVAEAKKRGISIIIDITFNHSSRYNDWFIQSKEFDNPYRGWYRWIEGDEPEYNINQKIWGHNVWNKTRDGYYAALFDSNMPDFNLDNTDLRAEMKKVLSFWLDKGVSGFRFDAVSHAYNSAELAKGEEGQEKAVAFWKEMTDYISANGGDVFNVGEVWEPTSTRATFLAGISSTFHFDLGTKIVDLIRYKEGGNNNFANAVYAEYQSYAASNPNYVDVPFLSNHDQNRIAGMLKNDPASMKLAASMYMFLEGIPFMYYGEEIGLNGAKPDEQIRTPMLWAQPGKDRTQTTWIESKYNLKTIPVSVQKKDPDSVLQFYKRVIRAKTSIPALYKGRFAPVATEKSEIISWTMEDKTVENGQKVFVLHNISLSPVTVSIPEEAFADTANISLLFATYKDTVLKSDNKTITISPQGSAVIGKMSEN